jgi:hypothetical protein
VDTLITKDISSKNNEDRLGMAGAVWTG